jgi:hypothetical protein
MTTRRARWFRLWKSRKDRRPRRAPLGLERLESRDLLSSGFGSLVQVGGPTPWPNTSDVSAQPGSTNYLNSEVEPRIAVDPTNPQHLVGVYQQDRWNDGGSRGIVAAVSNDGGNTWTNVPLPNQTVNTGGSFYRSSDPWVSIGPDGTVYSVTLPIDDPTHGYFDGVFAAASKDGGMTWSDPFPLTVNSNGGLTNDKESVTADPKKAGYAYAVWDRLNNGTLPTQGPGPALFSRTTDGGQTWSAPQDIYDPANGQTIGNQIVVLPDGTLVDVTLHIDYGGAPDQIVVVTSKDQGATWSAPTVVATTQGVGVYDPNTGGGVRVGGDLPEAAVDPTSGNLYVTWEDSRFSGNAHDGVVLTMSTDGGQTWSTPVAVNQTPTNIPNAYQQAFTPTVAVAADGEVAVSYYDFRNDTASDPGAATDAWIVFANPAQPSPLTFGNEQRLTDASFNMAQAPNAFGEFVGDYEGLTNGGQSFDTFGALFGAAVSSQEPSGTFFRGAVAPNPLSLTQFNAPSATEGVSTGGTLATFTDSSLDHSLSEYQAVVTWGDGTTDTLTSATGGIVANADGSFSVVDTHVYAEESAGQSFAVTVTTPGGFSAGSSATVAVADAPLTAGALMPPAATEGAAFSNATVFHFTDGNAAAAASDYTAVVTLGDGGTVTLTSTASANGQVVAQAGGGFDVQLTHTYAEETTGQTFAVAVTDVGGSSTSASTSTFAVADAALAASPTTFHAQEGSAVTGVTVATFTDADPAGAASDYSASVNWGDNDTTASVSVIADSSVAGRFNVVASKSQAYAEGGNYAVTVSISDAGGAFTSAASTAAVSDPALTATGTSIKTTEGASFTGRVATFTDAQVGQPASHYTAQIDWGDGTTSPGTVVATRTAGKFTVQGSHVYKEAGAYAVKVTITDAGGATATAASTATVADAALKGSLSSIHPVHGQPFSGTVATFTDANPFAAISDFTVTINWGDGTTSQATVVQNPNGSFSVISNHTYTNAGAFSITVTIVDDDGSKLTLKGKIKVT